METEWDRWYRALMGYKYTSLTERGRLGIAADADTPPLLEFDALKWTTPQNGAARVTAAGKIIAGRKPPTEKLGADAAFEVAANWRSSHGYPLQSLYMTLRNRAIRIDPDALVAQRLKRMPSVISKLKRFQGMQLSQMQDLGGCRAVVAKIEQVDQLVSMYEGSPPVSVSFCEKYDHIAKPKPDGYRGVHFVYKYNTRNPRTAHYNGLRIEVQIRSVYQHAWATALETIDTFTSQGLKAGLGRSKWKRFFVLASSFIAQALEDRPAVAGVRESKHWLFELYDLIKELSVVDTLEGLSTGLRVAEDVPASDSYILILDSQTKTTQVLGFNSNDEAAKKYVAIERSTMDQQNIQAVQVNTNSVAALHTAYPNYYLDTELFLGILGGILKTVAQLDKEHGSAE